MKKISRTIYTTTVKAAAVRSENGDVKAEHLAPLVFAGEKLTEERAMKEVVRSYGKHRQYIIVELKVEPETYEIDLDVFLTHATKVESPVNEA